MNASFVVFLSCAYVGFLFAIAYLTERLPYRWRQYLRASPLVYTLSIAVYCTSWTFYGAVGSAATRGLEFMTIYLGPTLVFFLWWLVLRKVVRVAGVQKSTSIADFLAGRYGKSNRLAALATLIALVGIAPYIALQLKAIATSFAVLTSQSSLDSPFSEVEFVTDVGFWTAVAMLVFVWLFGARNLEASEQHRGIIAAIAVESLVKFFALLAVGVFATSLLFAGGGNTSVGTQIFEIEALDAATRTVLSLENGSGFRWVSMLLLSGAAILCLPRQFQVIVVENQSEKHLATAAWLFPFYLLLLCLATLPIAMMGKVLLPQGSPDLYVLSLPLRMGNEGLALLAFIGGLSSATSMVILSSLALAIMISNHWIMPLILRVRTNQLGKVRDLTKLLIAVRQLSILLIIAAGFTYYQWSKDTGGLAAIGLISFTGCAQFLPTLLGAIYWRSASESAALAALASGFIVWLYCMFLPTLIPDFFPKAFNPDFWFEALNWDPMVATVFLSLSINSLVFIVVSAFSRMKPLEQLQAAFFVDTFRTEKTDVGQLWNRVAAVEDLYALVQRFVGVRRAHQEFCEYAKSQGHGELLPRLDAGLIPFVETLLAGAIGSASARVVVANIAQGDMISIDQLIKVVDETQQAIEYSQRLEQKSQELEKTAAELRLANEQLRRVDAMKDDFLSQVSHELRTPMTALRSFTEILLTYELSEEERTHNIRIIAQESQRLTRLLDDILRISRLEQGFDVTLRHDVDALLVCRQAMESLAVYARQRGVRVVDKLPQKAPLVFADQQRLAQVFVNLLSNAIKYNANQCARVEISLQEKESHVLFAIHDNGSGIDDSLRPHLFNKFTRSWQHVTSNQEGSGLGLAISKQILLLMQGDIGLDEDNKEGACFIVALKRG